MIKDKVSNMADSWSGLTETPVMRVYKNVKDWF